MIIARSPSKTLKIIKKGFAKYSNVVFDYHDKNHYLLIFIGNDNKLLIDKNYIPFCGLNAVMRKYKHVPFTYKLIPNDVKYIYTDKFKKNFLYCYSLWDYSY